MGNDKPSSEERLREAWDGVERRSARPTPPDFEEPVAPPSDPGPRPASDVQVAEQHEDEQFEGDNYYQAPPTERSINLGWLRFVIPIAIAGGSFFFTTIDDAERGESGEIVEAGDLDVFSMAVGDCFDDPPATDVVFSIDAVPCNQPHDNEVFALLSVAGDLGTDFPGEDALFTRGMEMCIGSPFASYVGTDYQVSELDVWTLTPTRESWADGDREIVCALYRLDFEKLTGTAKGSGL